MIVQRIIDQLEIFCITCINVCVQIYIICEYFKKYILSFCVTVYGTTCTTDIYC